MTDMTAPPPRVLDGVRVLDMTQVLAGPACCAMLGALGAEVIKVESSARMDLTRRIGVLDDINASPLFHTNNHNKRSIALNLRGEGGVELAKQLMSHCDVVVEAFRPGILERFGLDYDTLRERMPNLLMISISGNGQDGPEARYGAYAAIFRGAGRAGIPDGIPGRHADGVAGIGRSARGRDSVSGRTCGDPPPPAHRAGRAHRHLRP